MIVVEMKWLKPKQRHNYNHASFSYDRQNDDMVWYLLYRGINKVYTSGYYPQTSVISEDIT